MQKDKKKKESNQTVNEKIAYWLDYFNKKDEKEKKNEKDTNRK